MEHVNSQYVYGGNSKEATLRRQGNTKVQDKITLKILQTTITGSWPTLKEQHGGCHGKGTDGTAMLLTQTKTIAFVRAVLQEQR